MLLAAHVTLSPLKLSFGHVLERRGSQRRRYGWQRSNGESYHANSLLRSFNSLKFFFLWTYLYYNNKFKTFFYKNYSYLYFTYKLNSKFHVFTYNWLLTLFHSIKLTECHACNLPIKTTISTDPLLLPQHKWVDNKNRIKTQQCQYIFSELNILYQCRDTHNTHTLVNLNKTLKTQ